MLSRRAQADTPRVELGAHFSLIRLPRLDSTAPGVGGRITFNLNDHLAVEGEINLFPKDLPGRVSLSVSPFSHNHSDAGSLLAVRRSRSTSAAWSNSTLHAARSCASIWVTCRY